MSRRVEALGDGQPRGSAELRVPRMGHCSRCPDSFRLTTRGNLPHHVRTDSLRGRRRCEGSGNPPKSGPVLPRAGASWPPPPEVTVDYHRNQVLALTDSGEPFSQYVECSAGCGYVIGCGDAIESVTHGSCSTKEADHA